MRIDTIKNTLKEDHPHLAIANACDAVGISRATFYRNRIEKPTPEPTAGFPCSVPERALNVEQQQRVIDQLNSDRFRDKAPPQVYSTLLDEGAYLCSVSSMYRILRSRGELTERRNQRAPSTATRPELLAIGPNQVWSWDITKLKGPKKWSYYYLYVILDIFSRAVVGWTIVEQENANLAEAFIQEAYLREKVAHGMLTLHADRGSAMTSKVVTQLLVDLGVEQSHSRPHTSNDNPYSESHFKTMKSRPQLPERYGSVEDARELFRTLFDWYNNEHRHSGIAMLTPAMVHTGNGQRVLDARAVVLNLAYAAHPGRFVRKRPVPEQLPQKVWINHPSPTVECVDQSRQ